MDIALQIARCAGLIVYDCNYTMNPMSFIWFLWVHGLWMLQWSIVVIIELKSNIYVILGIRKMPYLLIILTRDACSGV